MKKWLAGAALAAAAVVSVPSAAQAAVTVDWDTSSGFVGKGDVQSAYGWNNAQMQQHQEKVRFAVLRTSEVEYECADGVHSESFVDERDVDHYLAYEQVASGRQNKKGALTGYRLIEQGHVYVDVHALPCEVGEPQNVEIVEETHRLFSRIGNNLSTLRLLHEEQTISPEVPEVIEEPELVGGA